MSLKTMITNPKRNKKIEILLIPCIYLTHCEFGELGSFFFKYKYSAI